MIGNLSIRARLTLLIGYLSISMLVGGAMGIYMLTLSNNSLRAIYNDSFSKLEQLDELNRTVDENQLLLQRLLAGKLSAQPDNDMTWNGLFQEFNDGRHQATQMAKRLQAMNWADNERAILDQMTTARLEYRKSGIDPLLAAIQSGDKSTALAVEQGQLHERQKVMTRYINALINFEHARAKQAYEQAQSDFSLLRALAVVLTLVGVVIAMVIGFWISRSITAPLGKAVEQVRRVASGDLSQRIQTDNSDNEISVLIRAVCNMNENLHGMVGQVRQITEGINSDSAGIATGSADLAQRIEQQAQSLSGTASAMAQMTGTVEHNTESAHHALKVASTTREIAETGGQTMQQVVTTMAEISSSSRKIVDIISVIEGIAFQTNILALNAAVEAARAGEQGRGFAVVAGEVRNLAQRSSEAAKEIKALIDSSVQSVKAGSDLVQQAGDNMEEILTVVGLFSDIMQSIYDASSQQSSGIASINRSVSDMDEMTHKNAQLVEDAADAARNLQERATALYKAVSMFKLAYGGGNNAASSASSRTANTGAEPRKSQPQRQTPPPRKAPAQPDSLAANEPQPTSTQKKLTDIETVGEEWEEF